jgi:dissimilatory sulfite reductase (desulfoviridin) alpha/beta subunit
LEKWRPQQGSTRPEVGAELFRQYSTIKHSSHQNSTTEFSIKVVVTENLVCMPTFLEKLIEVTLQWRYNGVRSGSQTGECRDRSDLESLNDRIEEEGGLCVGSEGSQRSIYRLGLSK